MAKDLKIPVIVCAQLNRGTEGKGQKEGSHKPALADLRESGSIEQDADVIIFLYRDDYYKMAEGENVSPDTEQNVAEVIIAKNRHGSTDTVKVGWTGRYTKFREIVNEGDLPH
jgi:replicative DNA helicase